jgi:hypothetical protein
VYIQSPEAMGFIVPRAFTRLLDNEKLMAILPEDDVAFLKFLFTSEGMNLRNNVSHCFIIEGLLGRNSVVAYYSIIKTWKSSTC